jgi:hypothetical protein
MTNNNDHRVGRLTWLRSTDGRWTTTGPVNGEADAFAAQAYRHADGGWQVTCTTYGRPLDSVVLDTLADAKWHAFTVYEAVELPNL